jgi:hypothetical protein
MDHPARRLRFRFMVVLAAVVFAIVLVVFIASVIQMYVAMHNASSFLGKLLLRWEM